MELNIIDKKSSSNSLKMNVILNSVKQICTFLFPLVTVPYISRTLGVESYGKYNYGNSIVGYFSLIAALGINTYAVREGAAIREEKKKIKQLCSELFTINILSTILSYCILAFVLFHVSDLYDLKLLIGVQSLSIIFSTIGTEWINIIYEDYVYITIRYIVIQVLSIILMLLFVHSPNDYIVYAAITVFASAGANLMNAFHIRKYVRFKIVRKIQIKKHLSSILMLFFNIMAITIYVNSDTTMLGIFVGDDAVGTYSLATKIYTIIKQVLSAIMVVTIPRLTLFWNKDRTKYANLINKLFLTIITIVVPAVLGLIMLSDNVILIIGGKQYLNGVPCLKILSFALLFATIAYLFSNCVLIINKKEKIVLAASVIGALANIVLNFYAIKKWSYIGASFTTVLSEFIVLFISLWKGKNCISISIAPKQVMGCLIGCLLIIFICVCIKISFPLTIAGTFLSIALSTFVYAVVMLIFENPICIQFMNFLRKK